MTQKDGGPTDAQMLNWLDSQCARNDMPVVFRWSGTGRGWRLHQDPSVGRFTTAREAICAAMLAERNKP